MLKDKGKEGEVEERYKMKNIMEGRERGMEGNGGVGDGEGRK